MDETGDLNVFFSPKSVAVVGATEKTGAWGAAVMRNLLARPYAGNIYPVNRTAERIFGVPAFEDVAQIPGPLDLAVLAIPAEAIEETVRACGRKGVKGVVIVTAGFAETSEQGLEKERSLATLARAQGMRVVGPNVSGLFNLHDHFVARGGRITEFLPTSLAAVTQGGVAFTDILTAGRNRGMGAGKLVHTGNECDLTITDFLEHFGQDPEVEAVLLYIEGIRDGRRFIDVARNVTGKKPVVAYKAGKTSGGARAARSHTAALAGRRELWEGVLRQVGVIISPTMELLLPLGHALVERPPMRGDRVGIITVGGSWGVILTDALEEAGLSVPELSPGLQRRLHEIGMPDRASTRNPIDIGAAGSVTSGDLVLHLGREALASGEIDALVLHGVGSPGTRTEDSPDFLKEQWERETRFFREFDSYEKEWQRPVLIGSRYSPWECQSVRDSTERGIRFVDDIQDIAHVLRALHTRWKSREGRSLPD